MMKKLTNRNQMRILINEMKANEDIATSTSIKTQEEITAFWCGLQLKLNKHGPPFKQLTGWKKVWADYRSNLKKKIRSIASNDWDPNRSVLLSDMEEEVIQLLGYESTVVLTSDHVTAEDSSSNDVYSLDSFQNSKEDATEKAAKAVKLYDLQIELLKKELHNWESIDKEDTEIAEKLNPSIFGADTTTSANDTTAAEMKIEFENFKVSYPTANISNTQNDHSDDMEHEKLIPKRRKLNTNDLSTKIAIEPVANYARKIKTEIIDESEIEFDTPDRTRPICSTNKGIFIIDTAVSPPLPPPLEPAPTVTPTPPVITKDSPPSTTKTATLPPQLKPAPHLTKRKFDASTNIRVPTTTTTVPENNSFSRHLILTNILNNLQEVRETNNNFTHYLEKLCALEEKKISLMQDANNEQKRHNQQMEKFARISL